MGNGDAISLQSIDLADTWTPFGRVETHATENSQYTAFQGDDEDDMSHRLTSYAQPISGATQDSENASMPERSPPENDPSLKNVGHTRTRRAPTSPRRRHASPLGRRVSLAVHNASARVVNLSNDVDSQVSITPGPRSPSHLDRIHEKNAISPDESILKLHAASSLRGRSYCMFGPGNRVRKAFCDLLLSPVTEPLILLVIVLHAVVLTIASSIRNVSDEGPVTWGTWPDWVLLAIFIVYTVESFVRSIVSGLWRNPAEFDIVSQAGPSVSVGQKPIFWSNTIMSGDFQMPSINGRSLQNTITPEQTKSIREHRKAAILRRAYLRHSFNRIDVLAISCYWLYLALAFTGLEQRYHIFIFKALSCLRILRLLNVTKGTATILKTLKNAAPLLVNVAFFVGFFWVFIAVIGVQSFKGSFRRQCVWVDPTGLQVGIQSYPQVSRN